MARRGRRSKQDGVSNGRGVEHERPRGRTPRVGIREVSNTRLHRRIPNRDGELQQPCNQPSTRFPTISVLSKDPLRLAPARPPPPAPTHFLKDADMEAGGAQDLPSTWYRPSSPVPTSTTGSDASKETVVIDLTSIGEKRPTHRSPFAGKAATKRVRLDVGKEAALKTTGIDLREMAYQEWDFVDAFTVPKAESKVCAPISLSRR